MPDGWNIGTIVTVITALGGILAVYVQGQRNKSDAIRMINESYSELCEQLRSRINQLHADIQAGDADRERMHEELAGHQEKLRQNTMEIRALQSDNEALRRENEHLKAQICELQTLLSESEKERIGLRTQVKDLSERLAVYENRPQRKTRVGQERKE